MQWNVNLQALSVSAADGDEESVSHSCPVSNPGPL
jgi:hypothetical protein